MIGSYVKGVELDTNKQQTCPAMGTQCYECGWKNHFTKMCRTKTRQTDEDNQVSTDMFIGAIQKRQNPR